MDVIKLGNSRLLHLVFKPAGMLMGSRLRKWLMSPVKTLEIANVRQGQTVLEIGCGTGFFTILAAEMVGDEGRVIALDASSDYLATVERKVEQAQLQNVDIIQRDALETGLAGESVDMVLLFGVIPFPLLPLDKLLPEMHRVLKPGACLSVWLFPPWVHNWVPKAIVRSNLFAQTGQRNSVFNFMRLE